MGSTKQKLIERLIPERAQAYREKIDFELNLFDRFPDKGEYLLCLLDRGVKVKNSVSSWTAFAIGVSDDIPSDHLTVKDAGYPDIDTDFGYPNKVFEYVRNKYGNDHVARVGSFQTMKVKWALKAIWRERNGGPLEFDHPINALCETIKAAPAIFKTERDYLLGFENEDGRHPGLIETHQGLRQHLEDYPEVKTLLFSILQKPHAAGQHAAGIVISPVPIDDICPTRYAGDQKVTQVDYRQLEKLGLLKYDFLGLVTLLYIDGALKLIKERRGITLDPWNLPDDQEVYSDFARAAVKTVFQFDTDVVYNFLIQTSPRSISDLAAITAVGRPGCLDSVMPDGRTVADHFIARKQNREAAAAIDPALDPILGDTVGLSVYQEQIQKIFEVAAGFSPLASDDARRAIGKKKLEIMEKIRPQFVEGCKTIHGWDEEKAISVWSSFLGAANYAFNKSHSFSYVTISYACAYLKHYYPLEWWCSVLTYVEAHGSKPDKLKDYLSAVHDAVDPPHVNSSRDRWTITPDSRLRAPLSLIKGVGTAALQDICSASPFVSIEDYRLRIGKAAKNKGVFTRLAVCGCFDGLPLRKGEAPVGDDYCAMIDFYINYDKGPRAKRELVPEKYRNLNRLDKILSKIDLMGLRRYNYISLLSDVFEYMESMDPISFSHKRIGEDAKVVRYLHGIPIIEDLTLLGQYHSMANHAPAAIAGLISNVKEFSYTSKRDGALQTALKVTVENGGHEVVIVLWPDAYSRVNKGDFVEDKFVIVIGEVRYSSYSHAYDIHYKEHVVF